MKKRSFLNILAVLMSLAILLVAYLLIDATMHDFKPEEEEVLNCIAPGSVDTIGDTLTLISWNIGYAGLGEGMDFFYDGGQRVRPEESRFHAYQDEILQFLSGLKENDFILLQEVDEASKRSYFSDQVERVATLFQGFCSNFAVNYKVKFVPVPLGRPMGRVASGVMTLGRAVPASSARVSLPGSFGWPKRLFMLDRCIMINRYPLSSGKELIVINLHNSAFDDTGRLRREELGKIRNIITEAYADGHYVIAGGDWNMNPPGFDPGSITTDSVFTIRHGVDDDFVPEGWIWAWDPAIPTNRDVSKAYRQGATGTTIIDFFLLSPNVRLLEVKTDHLGFSASDHHPVKIKVVLEHPSVNQEQAGDDSISQRLTL